MNSSGPVSVSDTFDVFLVSKTMFQLSPPLFLLLLQLTLSSFAFSLGFFFFFLSPKVLLFLAFFNGCNQSKWTVVLSVSCVFFTGVNCLTFSFVLLLLLFLLLFPTECSFYNQNFYLEFFPDSCHAKF